MGDAKTCGEKAGSFCAAPNFADEIVGQAGATVTFTNRIIGVLHVLLSGAPMQIVLVIHTAITVAMINLGLFGRCRSVKRMTDQACDLDRLRAAATIRNRQGAVAIPVNTWAANAVTIRPPDTAEAGNLVFRKSRRHAPFLVFKIHGSIQKR